MNDIILETNNLEFNNSIRYPDLKIYKNKVTFIVGKSGAGKSTLLRLFNGTLSPSNGTVLYNGEDTTQTDTIMLRQEVSLIGQSTYLFNGNIEDNYKEFYKFRNLPVPSEDRIKELLDICCLDLPIDKDCSTMSGGERQRVFISIYLSFIPKIIMLDEPTSALDSENSFKVISNVIDFCIKNNITVIIISHDNDLKEKFAQDTITIGEGEL